MIHQSSARTSGTHSYRLANFHRPKLDSERCWPCRCGNDNGDYWDICPGALEGSCTSVAAGAGGSGHNSTPWGNMSWSGLGITVTTSGVQLSLVLTTISEVILLMPFQHEE